MSQTSKLVLGIAVAGVILLGGLYYWHMRESAPAEESAEQTTLPSGTATDDSSINEDLSAIDAQIKAVNDDNASASESIDTAVTAQ